MAGYSVGEISSLYIGGLVSFEDGMLILMEITPYWSSWLSKIQKHLISGKNVLGTLTLVLILKINYYFFNFLKVGECRYLWNSLH